MNYLAFVLAMGLMGGGLWFSRDLGAVQTWLYGAGMLALFGMAAESCLARTHSSKAASVQNALSAWSVSLLFVASGMWLAQVAPSDWLLPVAVAMAATSGVYLLALRQGSIPGSPYGQYGRFVSNLLLFLVVFVLFALIYQTKERALFTATSTGVIALVASLELLRSGAERRLDRQVAVLAGIAALLIAEVTWVLGYWPVGGLIGGALLLLGFYVMVGLLQCIRDDGLARSAVLEYGAVGIVGFLAILIAVP